jgi:hypothetical protein
LITIFLLFSTGTCEEEDEFYANNRCDDSSDEFEDDDDIMIDENRYSRGSGRKDKSSSEPSKIKSLDLICPDVSFHELQAILGHVCSFLTLFYILD